MDIDFCCRTERSLEHFLNNLMYKLATHKMYQIFTCKKHLNVLKSNIVGKVYPLQFLKSKLFECINLFLKKIQENCKESFYSNLLVNTRQLYIIKQDKFNKLLYFLNFKT